MTTELPERLGVAENQQAHPNDPYEAISDIAEGQDFFDEIEFLPIGGDAGALSVTGATDLPEFGGEVSTTLWKGSATGEAVPGEEAMWLRLEVSTNEGQSHAEVTAFNPDAPRFDLNLPGVMQTPQFINSCSVLLDLLLEAARTDEGLVGESRKANFERLEDAVQDGYDGKDGPDESEGPGEDAELALHGYCEGSSFFSIAFAMKDLPGTDVLAVDAVLPTVAGDVSLGLWMQEVEGRDEPVLMLDLSGHVQELPDNYFNTELDTPWTQSMPQTQVKMALQYLRKIYTLALVLYAESADYGDEDVCAALTLLAMNGLKEGDPLPLAAYLPGTDFDDEDDEDAPAWHDALDEFTEHCKLDLLAGVVVAESLHRNLDIRAVTLDPVTRKQVPLQVFWKETGEEPEHWVTVGTASAPAHDDEDHTEVLSGFPLESKDHIRHAIDHLHAMVHVATDVVNGKTSEVEELLQIAALDRPFPEVVGGHMMAEAIEDALYGLNGVARLFTGSTDRELRNS